MACDLPDDRRADFADRRGMGVVAVAKGGIEVKTGRKNATWTTGEIRKMKQMHEASHPTRAELFAAFSNHPPSSVYQVAVGLGLRGNPRWLRIAHLHFQEREAEMRP
jgi:hypothetical protein